MVMIGSREVGAFMDEQKEKMLWEVKVQLIRHHWEQQWPPVFYSLNSKCFSSNFSLQPSPPRLFWTSKNASAFFAPFVFPQSPLKPFLRTHMYSTVKVGRDIPEKDKMLKVWVRWGHERRNQMKHNQQRSQLFPTSSVKLKRVWHTNLCIHYLCTYNLELPWLITQKLVNYKLILVVQLSLTIDFFHSFPSNTSHMFSCGQTLWYPPDHKQSLCYWIKN